MKILVTGGAGFVGSHLCERLLREGHTVSCYDNLDGGSLDNISTFKDSKEFTFINASILDVPSLEKASVDVEIIFHLAGKADIVPSVENPKIYFDVNVTGSFNVIEAARKNKVKRVVYAASSSCYGIPPQYPTNEKERISPEYPYAQTKYMGESCILHWGKVYNIEVNSLRLFNVYGPRSRTNGAYGAVMGVFLAQKLAKKKFTVVGDGTQVRDFIYVLDVVDAFYKAGMTKINGEIFNIATNNPQSINYLVELLDGEGVVYIPKRPGEPDRTHGDSTKANKDLNWFPKYSFENGVEEIKKNISYWKDSRVWTSSDIEKETKAWFEYLGDK